MTVQMPNLAHVDTKRITVRRQKVGTKKEANGQGFQETIGGHHAKGGDEIGFQVTLGGHHKKIKRLCTLD